MSQETTAPAGAVVAPPPKSRRGFFLKLLVVVLVLAAIGWTVWYFVDGRWYEDTDDAYVNGNVVQITPQIAGTVTSIGADDGDLVHQGDVLVKLDPSDAEVAPGKRARQPGQHRAPRARPVQQRGFGPGRCGRAPDRRGPCPCRLRPPPRPRQVRRDLGRGTVARPGYADLRRGQPVVRQAGVQQQQGPGRRYRRRLASGRARRRGQLRSAYLDDVRATLVAPVDGYVAKRTVQVGQRVQPGAALMAVVPLHQVWIDANFKETQLTHMRIGQPVDVTADVYGSDIVYKAKVRSLGVGSGSAFSILPAQNATGNWIKIVQRVPVRVVFTDPKQLEEKAAAPRPVDQGDGVAARPERPAAGEAGADRAGILHADLRQAARRCRQGHRSRDPRERLGRRRRATAGPEVRSGHEHRISTAEPGAVHGRAIARDLHAGARHHDRERLAADHRRQPGCQLQPEHLGDHLVRGEQCDRPAVDRLPHPALR